MLNISTDSAALLLPAIAFWVEPWNLLVKIGGNGNRETTKACRFECFRAVLAGYGWLVVPGKDCSAGPLIYN